MEKHSEETTLCSSESEQGESARNQTYSSKKPRATVVRQQSEESTTGTEGSHESSEKSTGEKEPSRGSGTSEKLLGEVVTESSSESVEKVPEGSEGSSDATEKSSILLATDTSSDMSVKFGQQLLYMEEDTIILSGESNSPPESNEQTRFIKGDSIAQTATPPPPVMDAIEPQSSTVKSEDSASLRCLERGENVLEVESAETKIKLKSNLFVFKCFKSQINYNFFKGLVEHLCNDFSANIIGNVTELCKSIARFLHVHSSMPSLQSRSHAEEGQISFKYSADELFRLSESLDDFFRRSGFPDIANFFQFLSQLSRSEKNEAEKIKIAVCELQKCLRLLEDQDKSVEEINELCRSYDVFPHEPPTETVPQSSGIAPEALESSSDRSAKEDIESHGTKYKNKDRHSSKVVHESSSPESDSCIETPHAYEMKLRFSRINYFNLYFPFIRYFLPRMNHLTSVDCILKCILEFFLTRTLDCVEVKHELAMPSDLRSWDIVCKSNDAVSLAERLQILFKEMGLPRFADILSYLLESRREYVSEVHPESSTDHTRSSRQSESDPNSNHAGRLLKCKIQSSVRSFPRIPALTGVGENLQESTASFLDPRLEDSSWNRPVVHTQIEGRTPDIVGSEEFANVEGKVIAIFITRHSGSRTPFCRFMREYFERYKEFNNIDEVFKFIANFILSNSKWKALKDEAEARELMQRQGIDQVFFWRSRDLFHLIREAETFFRGQSYTLLANFFNRLIAQEIARREGREYRYDNESMRYEHEQAGRKVVTYISSMKMIQTLQRIYSSLCEHKHEQSTTGPSQTIRNEVPTIESSQSSSEQTVQASDIPPRSESNEKVGEVSSERPVDVPVVESSKSEASSSKSEASSSKSEASSSRNIPEGVVEPNEGRIGRRYYITDYHLVPEFASYFLHHERSISDFSRVFKLIAEFLFHISRQYIFSVAEELKFEFFSRQDENISDMIEYLHTFLKERGLKIFANLVGALILRYKEERAIQSAFGAPEREIDTSSDAEIDFRSVGIIKKEIRNALGEFLGFSEGSQKLSMLYDQYVNMVSPPEPSVPISGSEALAVPGTSRQSTSTASEQKVTESCSAAKASGISIKLDSSITDGTLLSRLGHDLYSSEIDGANLNEVIQAVVDFFHYKFGSDIMSTSEAGNVVEETAGTSRILYVQTPITNFNFIFVLENFLRINDLHLTASVLLLLMEYVRVNETFFGKVSKIPPETLETQSELDPVEWRYFLLECISTKVEILNIDRNSSSSTKRSPYKMPSYKKGSKSTTGDRRPPLKTKAELKLYDTGIETTMSGMKRMRLSEAEAKHGALPETTERTVGEIYETAFAEREKAFKKSCLAELEKLVESADEESSDDTEQPQPEEESAELEQSQPKASDEPEHPKPEEQSLDSLASTSTTQECPKSSKPTSELSPKKKVLLQRRDRKRSQAERGAPSPEEEAKPPEQKVSKMSKKLGRGSKNASGSRE